MIGTWWTQGYDAVLELPDDETGSAVATGLGMQGIVRTETIRAYGRERCGGSSTNLPEHPSPIAADTSQNGTLFRIRSLVVSASSVLVIGGTPPAEGRRSACACSACLSIQIGKTANGQAAIRRGSQRQPFGRRPGPFRRSLCAGHRVSGTCSTNVCATTSPT